MHNLKRKYSNTSMLRRCIKCASIKREVNLKVANNEQWQI